MSARKFFIVCACVLFALAGYAQTKVIAHRGFWKAEGSAQNSLAALKKAAEAGLYGSEFDVQLTGDGVVIVNHDDTLAGKFISETPYAELRQVKLGNGEALPTLADYLEEGKRQDIKLILEIKPHKTKEQEDEITSSVVKMVEDMGMGGQIEYISFSMNICEQLTSLAPNSEIAYLQGDIAPEDIKAKGLTGIDYYYKVFEEHPEWVKEAQELGLKVNVWTVNETADMQKLIGMGVDYITTDQPLEAKTLVERH